MAVVVWHHGGRVVSDIEDGGGFTTGCGSSSNRVWVFIEICELRSLPFSD